MVATPQKWLWSSYRATGGTTKKETFLTTEWILAQFGLRRAEARRKYRQFVAEGMGEAEAPWEKLKGQIILGSDAFIERVREFFSSKEKVSEIPRLQRLAGRLSLEALFPTIEIRTRTERNQAIFEAHVRNGYTLKEIGEFLHLHYTTISKVIQAADAEK